MLLTIFFWIYAGLLFHIYGLLSVRLLNRFVKVKTPAIPFHLSFLTGLITLTVGLSYLSIFFRINKEAHLAVLMIGIIYSLLDSQYVLGSIRTMLEKIKNMNKGTYLLFFVMLIYLSCLCSFGPTVFDTGLYHLQAIKWIKEYAVVPGLGNLHGRLAFNSSWFLINALFDVGGLVFHPLNGLIMLVGFIFALSGLDGLLKRNHNIVNVAKALLVFPLIFLPTYFFASLSPDIPVTFLLYFLFFMLLENLEDAEKRNKPVLVFIAFSMVCFSITVKLNAVPALLLAFFLFWRFHKSAHQEKNKVIMISAFISFIIVTPWLIRNIFLSGYLIYPFPHLDLFSFDWEIPLQQVINEKASIDSWARMPGESPKKVLEGGFFYWVSLWIKRVQWDRQVLLFEISVISYIICSLIDLRGVWMNFKKYAFAYFSLLAGIVFWFLTAPDPRFAYGFLGALSILLISSLEMKLEILKRLRPGALLVIGSCALFVLFVLPTQILSNPIDGNKSFLSNLITLNKYPELALEKKTIQASQKIYLPAQSHQCWDAALPCTPYYNPKLELRGEHLGEGFRNKK